MADSTTIIASIGAALAGAVGSIGAARATTANKLEALAEAIKGVAARLKTLEESEPAELAKLRAEVRDLADGVERLASDLATVRVAHERLADAMSRHSDDENDRRQRAKSAAIDREAKQAKEIAGIMSDLARLRDKLDVLVELAGGMKAFAEAHRASPASR
jgi:chromosome segregation ATPase